MPADQQHNSRDPTLGFWKHCTSEQWHRPQHLSPQTTCSSCESWKEKEEPGHTVPSSTGVSLSNGPGKKTALNATISSQDEKLEGKKDRRSLETGQDEGGTTGEATEGQLCRQLCSSSLQVTGHRSAVTAGSSDEHGFFNQFPKHTKPVRVRLRSFPFKLESIGHFQTNLSHKDRVPTSFLNAGGQVKEKDPTDLKSLR